MDPNLGVRTVVSDLESPTTMAFLALSVVVVLGRSVAALGMHRLARVTPAERP